MSGIKQINLFYMLICISFLAVPILLAYKNKIHIYKPLSVSVSRMIAQLFAMGLVLQLLFKHDNPLFTTFWLFVMLVFCKHKSNI